MDTYSSGDKFDGCGGDEICDDGERSDIPGDRAVRKLRMRTEDRLMCLKHSFPLISYASTCTSMIILKYSLCAELEFKRPSLGTEAVSVRGKYHHPRPASLARIDTH